MGEAVGVIAAQSIGEPGTQLTMRTFHVGGTAQVVDSSFVESNFEGTISVRNRNVVRDSEGRLIVMGRNVTVVVLDADGSERATHRLIFGARLFVDDGDKVKRGQRIAEWDPYTRPIITEVDGTIGYEDLIDSQTIAESTDEATGITKRVVIDWRTSTRTSDLKPSLVIKGPDGRSRACRVVVKPVTRCRSTRFCRPTRVRRSMPATSSPVSRWKAPRPATSPVVCRASPNCSKPVVRRITPSSPSATASSASARTTRTSARILIEPADGSDSIEYLIPKGKHVHLQDGDTIEKGEYILDGNPAPHDILAIKGVEALAAFLVNEIQEVYRLQGVVINDKHIEVIVRQMLQKVEINDPGESDTINGEQIDRLDLDMMNEKLISEGKKPASGVPVLLGITKASLQTRSFISAASFQETTRVLTEAAVAGKIDALEGLKENVIVGRLIPAGTGSVMSRVRSIAGHRDELIVEERKTQTTPVSIERPALPAAE